MKTADIDVNGVYRVGRHKVRVKEKGVERRISPGYYSGSRKTTRADGARVEYLDRNDMAIDDLRLPKLINSRDIDRQWTTQDEERRQRDFKAEDKEAELTKRLLDAGFIYVNVSITPSERALDADTDGFRIRLTCSESSEVVKIIDTLTANPIK